MKCEYADFADAGPEPCERDARFCLQYGVDWELLRVSPTDGQAAEMEIYV